jgi:hypothetical protein
MWMARSSLQLGTIFARSRLVVDPERPDPSVGVNDGPAGRAGGSRHEAGEEENGRADHRSQYVNYFALVTFVHRAVPLSL